MLLKLKEVAIELGTNYEAVRLLIARNELVGIRLTERAIRVHPDDLKAYIKRKQQEATKQCNSQRTKKQGVSSIVSMIRKE